MCEKVQENVKIVLKKLLERCRKCWKSPKVSGHFPLTSWFKVTDRLLLETCDPFFTIYEKAKKLWIYELPKLFLNYAWDRPEICLEFSWDISEIDLRNKSDMLDICLKFARELSEICVINICDLHEICLRYAGNLHEISRRFASNSPEICLRYYWHMPEIYGWDILEIFIGLVFLQICIRAKNSVTEWVSEWKSDF